MTEIPSERAPRAIRGKEYFHGIVSVALLVAATTVTWSTLAKPKPAGHVEPKVPAKLQSTDSVPSKGRLTAPAVLIGYSDFQCPFCKRFAMEILPALDARYIASGRLRFAFRHYPIKSHPFALGAAEAAACAFRQNKFWEVHDELFKKGASLDPPGLLAAVSRVGVDVDKWEKCVANGPVKEVVDDLDTSNGLGIGGTPFFLLGISTQQGVRVTKAFAGARPIEVFAQLIDETLSSAVKVSDAKR